MMQPLARQEDPQTPADTTSAARLIAIRRGQDILLRPLGEVRCLQAEGKYSRVLLAGDESGLLQHGIQAVQALLPPRMFFEVYRGVLVNLRLIQRIRRDEFGRMFLHLHGRADRILVSRTQEQVFRAGIF